MTTSYDEQARLARLRRLDALSLTGDPTMARIARTAAAVAGTPTAGVHLVDDLWQHRVAAVGVATAPVPRGDSPCNLVVEQNRPVHVGDATADSRFAGHPCARGDDPVRFYVGVPLLSPDGPLGTVCAWSPETGHDSAAALAALTDLAAIVVETLDLHHTVRTLADAATDELTGLVDGRVLTDHVGHLLAAHRRGGPAVGVLFLDLDGFESIVHQHGQAVGDEVLRWVGRRLRATIHTSEVAARVGGHEFVVVGGADLATRPSVARFFRILTDPIPTAAGLVTVGGSTGTVLAQPDEDVDGLLGRVDRSTYASKGRPLAADRTPSRA